MGGEYMSVFVVVNVVFGNICFVEGTEGGNKLRRFLDQHITHGACRDACLHGSCDLYLGRCRCDHGWTGRMCDESVATTGTCHHDRDCNTAITCDVGTKPICYFDQICACVSSHHHHDRNLVYESRHSDAFRNRVKRFLHMGMSIQSGGNHCGPYYCAHGSCQYQTMNGVSTHSCTCYKGWHGEQCDESTSMINQGGGNHCGPYYCAHGSCQYQTMNGVSTHSCTCYKGWHGEQCDQSTSHQSSFHGKDCTSYQCYHGHCMVTNQNHEYCQCNDGWAGYQCQTYITSTGMINQGGGNHCGPYYCAHGSCQYQTMNGVSTHSCTCYKGWHGEQCDQSTSHQSSFHGKDCTSYQCYHGHCMVTHQNHEYCQCNDGWAGYQCQTYITSTVPTSTTKLTTIASGNKIGYHSACNFHGYWTTAGCQCHDYWSGHTCQYPPGSGHYDHCHNHCGEHGTCFRHQTNLGNEYWSCKCDNGWHGQHCTSQYIYTPVGTTHCHNTYCAHGMCSSSEDSQGHRWNYHCTCYHGWDGKHCDQAIKTSHPSSSTTPPTTKTTTKTTSTTTSTTTTPTLTTKQTTLLPASATSSVVFTKSMAPISTTSVSLASTVLTLTTCDHVDTLSAIAQQTQISNKNAMECSPGDHTSHEALVLTDCSVPRNPSLWKQGVNVMSGCSSSNAIPTYSPIAAFDHGQYLSIGSLSGVFLGCTTDGFKVAIQRCGQAPYIAELQLGGSNTQNPNMYYTIS